MPSVVQWIIPLGGGFAASFQRRAQRLLDGDTQEAQVACRQRGRSLLFRFVQKEEDLCCGARLV